MNKGRISTALIAAIIAVLVIASASLIYQQSSTRARETQSMQKALTDWDRAQRGQKQPVPIYPRP